MAKAKTEVAKTEDTKKMEVMAFDYGDAEAEDFSSDDIVIPFINLLQPLSKVVASGNNSDAKAGLWYNTATGELMESFNFLPVYREEMWVEWVPRSQAGGSSTPVGFHEPDSEAVTKILEANGGNRVPPMGADGKRAAFKIGANDLIETHYLHGLVLDDEAEHATGFGIIAINGSKIMPMKKWNTSRMSLKGTFGKIPPLNANRVHITTTSEINNQGQPYKNVSFRPVGSSWLDCLIDPRGSLYAEGMGFLDMIKSGKAKVDFSKQDDGGEVSSETSGGRRVPDADEEAPF